MKEDTHTLKLNSQNSPLTVFMLFIMFCVLKQIFT